MSEQRSTVRSTLRRIRRRRLVGGAAASAAAVLALVLATGAAADIFSVFKLDGTATGVSLTGSLPDDWNRLFPSGTAGVGSDHALVQQFVHDTANVDTTYFTGGGSKDIYDIQGNWQDDQTSSAQPKADISDAFAAAYVDPANSHLNVYFGADRYSNNGATFVGFWLLQNPLTFGPFASNGVGPINGSHVPGDILVLSDFTQGGTVQNFSVYKWVTSGGDASTHLRTVYTGTDCKITQSDKPACSTVNSGPTPAPWPFTPASNVGPSGTFATGTFIEGGLDVNALVSGFHGCFAGFVMETRASFSVSSTLSDFAYGELSTCGALKVVKNTVGGDGTFAFTGGGSGVSSNFNLTTSAASGHTASTTFSNLTPGSGYSLAETVPAGWDLTSATCDNGNTNLTNITIPFGTTVTCTFTNTERGHIIVDKVTDPSSDTTTQFAFTSNYGSGFNLVGGGSNDSGALVPGSYNVAETPTTGWDLTSATCDNGDAPSAITLGAGQTVTCTFTNTERGNVALVKTVSGGPIPAGDSFTFQVRQGASTTSDGTVLSTVVVDSTTAMPVNLDPLHSLTPGVYQICELAPGPGWTMSITSLSGAFEPNGGTSGYFCAPITVTAGQTTTVTLDNTPPPGGVALTIGYWKTHSCQAPGNQADVLDQTLALFPVATLQTQPGFYVGTLYVDTCNEAVSLLSKTPIDGTKNSASDPAFNFAAQYVAYKLNIMAGAYDSAAADAAAADGQSILVAIGFDGTATHLALTAAQKTAILADAGVLDQYNNNLL